MQVSEEQEHDEEALLLNLEQVLEWVVEKRLCYLCSQHEETLSRSLPLYLLLDDHFRLEQSMVLDLFHGSLQTGSYTCLISLMSSYTRSDFTHLVLKQAWEAYFKGSTMVLDMMCAIVKRKQLREADAKNLINVWFKDVVQVSEELLDWLSILLSTQPSMRVPKLEEKILSKKSSFCLRWVKQQLEAKNDLLGAQEVFRILKVDQKEYSIDFFQCLSTSILLIGEGQGILTLSPIQVHHDLARLTGLEFLWRICLMPTLNQACFHACTSLLMELYHSVQLKDIPDSLACFIQRVLGALRGGRAKGLHVLASVLNFADSQGTRGFRSHGARLKGRPLHLSLELGLESELYTTLVPRHVSDTRSQVEFFSNATLWDIRCAMARLCRVPPSLVMILVDEQVLESSNNARTLLDLDIKDKAQIKGFRRDKTEHSTRKLLQLGELTQDAKKALITIYDEWAIDGDLPFIQFMAYFQFCTGVLSVDPTQIRALYNKHTDLENNVFDLSSFLRFYTKNALSHPESVWKDLNGHGFGADLIRENDTRLTTMLKVPQDEETLKGSTSLGTMWRDALSDQYQEIYDVLFKSSLKTAWDLLMRLPTSQFILSQLSDMQPDFMSLLTTSTHGRMLYSLQIAESLLLANGQGQQPTSPVVESKGWVHKQDMHRRQSLHAVSSSQFALDDTGRSVGSKRKRQSIFSRRSEWCSKFVVQHNGFRHLVGMLMKWEKTAQVQDSWSEHLKQECYSILLKLVSFFLVSSYGTDVEQGNGDLLFALHLSEPAKKCVRAQANLHALQTRMLTLLLDSGEEKWVSFASMVLETCIEEDHQLFEPLMKATLARGVLDVRTSVAVRESLQGVLFRVFHKQASFKSTLYTLVQAMDLEEVSDQGFQLLGALGPKPVDVSFFDADFLKRGSIEYLSMLVELRDSKGASPVDALDLAFTASASKRDVLFNFLQVGFKYSDLFMCLLLKRTRDFFVSTPNYVPLGPVSVGLRNLGATCYVNSTLQLVFASPLFRRALLQDHSKPELARVMDQLQSSRESEISPTSLVKSLGIDNVYVQEDAHEFLVLHLLAKLQEGVEVSRVLVCEACGHTETKPTEKTPVLSVELNNQHSLTRALHQLEHTSEVLEGFNCGHCKQASQVRQSSNLLDPLPPSLFVHLKRFNFDVSSLTMKKNSQRFVLPLHEGVEIHRELYHIKSVVCHSGDTGNSGHYFTFTKGDDGQVSYFFDLCKCNTYSHIIHLHN